MNYEDQIAALLNQQAQPVDQDRINALRRQQAIGMLGTMGGRNVGRFGAALHEGASQQLEDERTQQRQGLSDTMDAIKLATELKQLQTSGQPKWKVGEVDGRLYRHNDQGAVEWLDSAGAPGAGVTGPLGMEIPKGMKESEGKAYFQAIEAGRAFKDLNAMLGGGYEPGLVADQMYRGGMLGRGAQVLSDSQDQRFVTTGMKIAESILRAQTGAAAPEHEVRNYAMMYVPQWYEDKETQRWKLESLKDTIRALSMRAGPGAKQLQYAFADLLGDVEGGDEIVELGD